MHIIYFKSEIILSVTSVGSLLSCFFPDKVVKLIRGGSVINGATPSSFNINVFSFYLLGTAPKILICLRTYSAPSCYGQLRLGQTILLLIRLL